MAQIILFLSGAITGFFAGYFVGKRKYGFSPNWERTSLAIVITFLWGASVVYSITNPQYQTPTALHGILGLVAGYFFQGSVVEAIKNMRTPKQ